MEAEILLWIQNNIRFSGFNPVMEAITHLGDFGLFWILMMVVLLLSQKTRKIGVAVGIALLGSFVFNNLLLKNLVARTRPYEVIDGLQLLVSRAVDSGHAASSFAAAVVMAKLLPKRYGIAALILAGLIAFSRLYVGIHYPTDVLFGAVSGCLIGWLVAKFYGEKAVSHN